jgi:putative endopeptidase
MNRFLTRSALAGLLASFACAAPAALDVAGLDTAIDACTDFYGYANRKWLEVTQIPDDRSSWGTGALVDQRNEQVLTGALQEALRQPLPPAGSPQRKVIEYYASGMDTAAIDKAGLTPLAPVMKRVASVSGPAELARTLGYLHTQGIPAGFTFGVQQDAKDSTRYLAEIDQGGLGLPERDYYFKDDERSKQQRDAYVKHVSRMFELAGDAPEAAARNAATVLALETELARSSMTNTELRDEEKTYNKGTIASLSKDAPGFPWNAYFAALGIKDLKEVNVGQPEFFKTLARLSKEQSPAQWQTYLRWHVLNATATKLPQKFEQENFAFFQQVLKGVKTQPTRSRRVITTIGGNYGEQPMGQALARIFVDKAFTPEAKERSKELITNVKSALGDRIRTVDWMSDETRRKALEKLAAMNVKIGYPDKWRDYSTADVGPHSYVENWLRANAFEHARDVRRVTSPVDRTEWWMSPYVVNAYYDARKNEIVFPAGILQPPFFDAKADDALNYGGIGMVIGHEITHGFDDTGRKFDARGNMSDWWTAEDAKRYEERAQRMERQYSQYEGVEGLKLNGKLTLGENISDLGGLKIAYLALQKALKDKPQGPIDGLSQEQRFFLSYAQTWRSRQRAEQERLYIQTNTHSPPRFRVRGPLANMPEYAKAFSCDPGKTLLSESERANIW